MFKPLLLYVFLCISLSSLVMSFVCVCVCVLLLLFVCIHVKYIYFFIFPALKYTFMLCAIQRFGDNMVYLLPAANKQFMDKCVQIMQMFCLSISLNGMCVCVCVCAKIQQEDDKSCIYICRMEEWERICDICNFCSQLFCENIINE